MRILEHLDELTLGFRGQTTGMDIEHPHGVSPTLADLAALLTDVPQALFDAP